MASSERYDQRAVVEARLRRLPTADCAAFVADLWAERGYETSRDGTVVTASRGRDTVTIHVGGRQSGAAPPDSVVVLDGSGTAPSGVRVLDAGDLTERLWYAVDRSVARALCERHLGAPPGDLRPPLGMRARRRLQRAPGVAVSVAAVVLAVVAVGALAGGVPSGGETVAPAGSDRQTPATETPLTAVADGPEPVSAGGFPPGVDSTGVQSRSTLATAHREAVAGQALTLWIDRRRPELQNGTWTTAEIDLDLTTNGDQYQLVVSEGPRGDRMRLGTLYFDGDETYARVVTGENATYRRISPTEQTRSPLPTPTGVASRLVTRYLSTPETEFVGRVERDGRTLYRVAGYGTPENPELSSVQNYSVVADIDSSGLVYHLDAEYTRTTGDQQYTLTRNVTYARLGETTVTPPDWYEERFASGATPTP